MTQRPPWTVFRAALEERGFRPSRRLGQNFLLDENMVRAIVRDARIEAGDFVLEIGAGCGFLSLHLLDAGANLVCVEIDERLLPTQLDSSPATEREVRRGRRARRRTRSRVRWLRLARRRPWHP